MHASAIKPIELMGVNCYLCVNLQLHVELENWRAFGALS